MMKGIELILQERIRQIEKCGWTSAHDVANHPDGSLADAATCYAIVAAATARGSNAKEWPANCFDGFTSLPVWPFADGNWKPSDDPIRNLQKAGALIAAEIDRILRTRA